MRRIDLQLFSEERREAPTPKRRRDARRKGQVFRSNEATAAVMLLSTFAVVRLSIGLVYARIRELFGVAYEGFLGVEIGPDEVMELAGQGIGLGFSALAPILVSVVILGLGVTAAQVGLNLTSYPVTPRLDRLDPIKGMQRLLSMRALVELAKGIIKLSVMGTVIYLTMSPALLVTPLQVDMPLEGAIGEIGALLWTLAWRSALTLLILGIADLGYQYWEHERGLKMTSRELKEEHRDTEGDPVTQQRQRERARQLSRARMIADVAKSDVVVVNPTRYAVALKYDPAKMTVPVVTARGRNLLAARIRDLARQHGVTVVENRALAPVLYRNTEVGRPVPADLYHAVAEILAYVWRVENRNVTWEV